MQAGPPTASGRQYVVTAHGCARVAPGSWCPMMAKHGVNAALVLHGSLGNVLLVNTGAPCPDGRAPEVSLFRGLVEKALESGVTAKDAELRTHLTIRPATAAEDKKSAPRHRVELLS